MAFWITVLPGGARVKAQPGETLLAVLAREKLMTDAPCGGRGTCGKCRVTVDGHSCLACQTEVRSDLTVMLPQTGQTHVLTGRSPVRPGLPGYALAFDLGTTTVAGFLMDGEAGTVLASLGRPNDQRAYGADVVSRVGYDLKNSGVLTLCIRRQVGEMATALCEAGGIRPASVRNLALVGNPAMVQLFLGLGTQTLARPPYSPASWQTKLFLPGVPGEVLVLPAIGGFVGGDTTACLLAAETDRTEELRLLVDIGTNGELVLGDRHRRVACSTAAGPALEGADIRFGMTAGDGAIHKVWVDDGKLCCAWYGQRAVGICGSGLIDAVAAGLELGLINARGRLSVERLQLTEDVYLTQEDIRQVQLAKGAIAAGISLLAEYCGVTTGDIRQVQLAGAFGSFLNVKSACRIGLLPPELEGRCAALGNLAGSGAKMLACDPRLLDRGIQLARETEHLPLGEQKNFSRRFAEEMRFTDG